MRSTRALWLATALGLATLSPAHAQQQELLNASYDIARELFADVNKAFVPYWKKKTGQDVTVKQSHAGSSSQARSIREGLPADVVTFNQVTDVQVLADAKLVAADWQKRFPDNASPYYSLHTIIVRKGNPKNIKDWDDLAKPGVAVVQVNPKTGGNGRYAVLAYYVNGLAKNGGNVDKAKAFVKSVLANVTVFETGGRSATTAFTDRGIGDVLVNFESEALALVAGPNSQYEIVTPKVSIQSEFPVAVVDTVANRRGTTALAKGYLEYLYTPEAQEVIAQNFYRPRDAKVAARHAAKLAPVTTKEVEKDLGGWTQVNAQFFANNALVDTLLKEVAAERAK